MSIFREAIVDTSGQVDVANLALFWLMFAVLSTITFMCFMVAFVFWRCTANCTFDPQPLGMAIGAACAGFATALGALAAYMLAVRPPKKSEDRDVDHR